MSLNPYQSSINLEPALSGLLIASFGERSTTSLVPNGTTASYQKLRIPGPVRLVRLSWSAVLAPGAGETIALRLYRVRPASNPAGFGYIQLNNTYTISAGNFTGAGNHVDISSTIRNNLCVLDDEYLACSWVRSGTAGLQPLNMS